MVFMFSFLSKNIKDLLFYSLSQKSQNLWSLRILGDLYYPRHDSLISSVNLCVGCFLCEKSLRNSFCYWHLENNILNLFYTLLFILFVCLVCLLVQDQASIGSSGSKLTGEMRCGEALLTSTQSRHWRWARFLHASLCKIVTLLWLLVLFAFQLSLRQWLTAGCGFMWDPRYSVYYVH